MSLFHCSPYCCFQIKREVSFKNVQKQLDKWDPIVIKNRVSDNLVFPLKSESVHKINPKEFLDPNQVKCMCINNILLV